VQLLRGALKDYPWGRIDGLAQWAGGPTGGPQAELWFGVHPAARSPLIDADGGVTGQHLDDVLSIESAPVLVKLLAAAEPLSVQIHPVAEVARAQWQAQHAGAEEVYADPFEKSEVMLALEPFRAFAGWRAPDEVRALLAGIPGTESVRAVAEDRIAAVRAVLDLAGDLNGDPDGDLATMIAALPAAAQVLDDAAQRAYRDVAERYPQDIGALVTTLLDTVTLQPGEAIYLPAGVPHSYLDGLGVEVMTTSDNVARLGLTGKPVFADHALAAIRPERDPAWMRAGTARTPAGFDLTLLRDGSQTLSSGRYRVVLAIESDVQVDGVPVPVGAAAVVTADEPDALVTARGVAALVTAAVP
jgi:mannose-6-phosphate isomerase